MCGRFELRADPEDCRLAAVFEAMERRYPGQYKTGEIFPGDAVPGIINDGGRLRPVPAVFGFAAAQGSRPLINARSETAAQKSAFAESLRKRRIALPASGFYEWERSGGREKRFFAPEEGRTVYLCGLYRTEGGVFRFVILTRPAVQPVRSVHDRMPVMIAYGKVRAYLTDPEAAMELLAVQGPAVCLSRE